MISIIVPTYNEKENIGNLLEQLDHQIPALMGDFEVVIIDDNSPDGTGEYAASLKKEFSIRVVIRKDKKGLSSAIIDGFQEAKGDIFVVLDADLSHPISAIPPMVERLRLGYAMIIGSRYTPEGSTLGWPLRRKIISKGATLLARVFLRTDIKDPLSGFFAIKKEVVEGVKLNPLGFKIVLEILSKGNHKQKIGEYPILFKDREKGESKLTLKVCLEYVKQLISLL